MSDGECRGLTYWLAQTDTRHSGGPYYVLVASNSPWEEPDDRLGADSCLGVPRLGLASSLAGWIVPSPYPGHLCAPTRLRTLLATTPTPEAVE
ncbi:hypothetical protein [Streptomyces sp. G45]|uniref:hypothetical protein n=1 Tax=Streptomyces sp. G45 TaxID=3406627 RepID=UPI003C29199F